MTVGTRFPYEDINYCILESNELQVGYGLTESPFTSAVSKEYESEKVTIPPCIEYSGKNYTVTVFGAHAFYACNSIKAIEIPFTATTLNWSCFGAMKALELIIIPPNSRLQTVDQGVIHACSVLKYFVIPSTVKYIDYRSFSDTSATIWYRGFSKFDVNFGNYNKTIHVPLSYKYKTFGNLHVIKDITWIPSVCVTQCNKKTHHRSCVVFVFLVCY